MCLKLPGCVSFKTSFSLSECWSHHGDLVSGAGLPPRGSHRNWRTMAKVYTSISVGSALCKCWCFSGCYNLHMPSSPTPAWDPACTSGPNYCPGAKSSAPVIPEPTCSNAEQTSPLGCFACTSNSARLPSQVCSLCHMLGSRAGPSPHGDAGRSRD